MATLGATSSITPFVSSAGYGGMYKAGWYVFAQLTGVGTVVAAVNVMGLSRVTIPKAVTVDRIGCEVTTVAASSTVRLGIYDQTADGLPGALILDAGTIDSASGTGNKEITISQALDPGHYWLAGAAQGGTPTMRSWTGGWSGVQPDPYGPDSVSYVGFNTGATVSGALPSPVTLNWSAQPIRVWLRYV